MREFGFEMRLCAHLEAEGRLCARQLGASPEGSRVMDVVCVEPGPEFEARTRLTAETIPPAAIEAEVGVGRARRASAVVDGRPEYVRSLVERAVEVGFFERERRGGQAYVRQAARYPDWFGDLVAVENKPDLGRPGDLERQLRTDVSLGLFDRVYLCTATHVTGAHLNRLPDAVGVWRFDPETGARETVREAAPLDADGPGLDLLAERPGRTDVRPVSGAEKARYRRRVAERAYGKGWRVPFPDCPNVEERRLAGVGGLAYCSEAGRVVGAAAPCDCPESGGPTVDLAARRAEHSPWMPDPSGVTRRQSGLDRFAAAGEE